jgi:KDO2-lipid IV(A) lauroyltransferase
MKLLDTVRRRLAAAILRATGALGCRAARSVGVGLARFLQLVPALRQRLVTNLRAAGVDATEATVKAYFRRMGLWMGHSLGVFAAGLDRSLVGTQIELDPDTIHHLDEAVAKGKGVVLAAPHLFCHELGAALIHRRYPVTALVRESKDPGWVPIKQRWYGSALGLQTVFRPRRSSLAGDMVAALRVLRARQLLGITPDVLTSRGSGVPVTLFGRTVSLSPGMILLAKRTGAPLITVGGKWFTDPSAPSRERARVTFSPPLELPGGDRDAALRDGLQRWCGQFEAYLRRSPADWQFWLDKGWTRVLRGRRVVEREGRAAA